MVAPHVTPESRVTRLTKDDPTQGPGCAIAAGAATIYRTTTRSDSDAEGQTTIGR